MDEQDAGPDLSWEAWPACPGCGRARQCICPVCQTAGADFPLAEYQAAPAPLRSSLGEADSHSPPAPEPVAWPLLHCPTCDEVFRPRFYHRCHACGYRFCEGIELDTPAADGVSARLLLATSILLGAAGTLFLYFWWLLRAA